MYLETSLPGFLGAEDFYVCYFYPLFGKNDTYGEAIQFNLGKINSPDISVCVTLSIQINWHMKQIHRNLKRTNWILIVMTVFLIVAVIVLLNLILG